MSSSTNPFKTLSISNTCLTTSLHNPSIFIPKSPYISLPLKPSKLSFPLSFSSSSSLSPYRPIFSSTIVPNIAQTSEWEQEGSSTVLESEQEEGNWDFQGFGDNETKVSNFGEESDEVFSEPPEDAKLFVGNLSYDVDSERLAQIFEGAGVVEIAEVIYNRETERSRGFGFVTMSSVDEAEKAEEMFNRYELNGRLLTVNKAAPRGSRPERPQEFEPSFRIYVGNLPWDVDNACLEQVFSEHGKVLSARVVFDRETGRSRGFGFVTMASETGMNDAIAALDGQTLDGRTIRVNVAEDRPRRIF